MAMYSNILETIGDTPLVKLNTLAPAGVNLYVKLEAFNPMGSVKDRMALAMIEAAENCGELQPGQTVIEATSGNTGLGLAMVCAQKGYPLVIVMAENFSLERRKMLRYLGAKVVLTPAAEKGTGMMLKAQELAEKHGYFLCRQFENQANADVHERTTATEIVRDLLGQKLHYWVTGCGTGGTLQGTARGLKKVDPETQIVVAEPDNSQLIGSGIEQPKNHQGEINNSHPSFRPHLMQGWTPDFISKLADSAIDSQLIDQTLPIAGQQALNTARELALKEGIFAGISSGATLAGALQIAATAPTGTNIVCMLPDTGERYLSTPLFENIHVDMNEQEIELANSTSSCRFADNTPTDTLVVPIKTHNKPDHAYRLTPRDETIELGPKSFVVDVVKNEKVVLFALEWCEFCWAARKLFKALNVDYVSIDIDSVAYQKQSFGYGIRQTLINQYQLKTIPQIFIGQTHLGGATELFEATRNNSIFELFTQANVEFTKPKNLVLENYLPNWVNPRMRA